MRNQTRMRRLKSLEKIVKEEVLKKRSNVLDNAIFDYGNIDDNPNNVWILPHLAYIEAKDQKYNEISKLASFDIKAR